MQLTDRTLLYIIFVFGVLDILFMVMWLWEKFKEWLDKQVKEELDKKFKEIKK